jgi:hypothetical protein
MCPCVCVCVCVCLCVCERERERVWLQKFGTFSHLHGRMTLLQQLRNNDPRTSHFFILSKWEWELWSAEGPMLTICSYNTNQAGNMMHLRTLSLSKTQGNTTSKSGIVYTSKAWGERLTYDAESKLNQFRDVKVNLVIVQQCHCIWNVYKTSRGRTHGLPACQPARHWTGAKWLILWYVKSASIPSSHVNLAIYHYHFSTQCHLQFYKNTSKYLKRESTSDSSLLSDDDLLGSTVYMTPKLKPCNSNILSRRNGEYDKL